ncbi:MAG: hypothetical protein AAGA85_22385 [Bacteroidota bacterium]
MRTSLLMCLSLLAQIAWTQHLAGFDTLAALNLKYGDALIKISDPFAPQRSDFYVESDWQYCLALTTKGKVLPFSCRINLVRTHVEAIANRQIRKLRSSAIQSLLVAGKEYAYYEADAVDGQQLQGFFEILNRGEVTLLKKYEIGLERANDFGIDPGIDNSNDQMVLKWSFYYSKDGQRVQPLGKSRKNILEVFAPYENKMKDFIKENHLKWKDPSYLSPAFDYYNRTAKDWEVGDSD